MSCYINVYILIFTIKIYCVSANVNIINHGVVPLHRGSVSLQFYVELENNSKSKRCCVSSFKNRCCLGNKGKSSSNIVDVYGGDMTVLEPYERKQLLFVYPTLYQHDRVGVCDITLLYDCGDRFKMKRKAKLTFDTTVFNSHKKRAHRNILREYYNGENKLKQCDSEDSNPLDECAPVNCDWKYDGFKPFFEKHSKRCVEAPPCVGDEIEGMPELVYVPVANKCRDVANPISVEDIYAMSGGGVFITEKTTLRPSPKVNLVKNLTSISQNLQFLRDMLYGRVQCADDSVNFYKQSTQNAFHFIITYIGGITALILSIACLLNVCVFMLKRLPGCKDGCCPTIVNKFRGNQSSRNSRTEVAKEVKESLLRDVIVTDIPLELRESIVDICDRMGNDVRRKKRYRFEELGSQISLQGDEGIEVYRESDTSTTTCSYDDFRCDN